MYSIHNLCEKNLRTYHLNNKTTTLSIVYYLPQQIITFIISFFTFEPCLKKKKLLPDAAMAFWQHKLPLRRTLQKEPYVESINNGKKNGTVETKPRFGRPPIFNDRKRRELRRVVRTNCRATLKEISQLISSKVCEDTICNELKKKTWLCLSCGCQEAFLERKAAKGKIYLCQKKK